MKPDTLLPVLLFFAEAAAVASVLLVLFSVRRELGLGPLGVTIGVLMLLRNVLAATLYVRIAPGVLIGPLSVVVFTANLSMILLVYIREDALEARKLAYGAIAANLLVGILMYLTGIVLEQPWVVNLAGAPPGLFKQNLRVSIAGTAALAVDVIGIILLYEALGRWLRRSFFIRIWISLSVVLAVDTLLFCTGAFVGRPAYGAILAWTLIGQMICGLLFAGLLRLYLHCTGRGDVDWPRGALRGIFHLLTFREKYEAMSQLVYRDALTGVYSRRFFDEILPRELNLARRSQRPVALIMIDLDDFKAVNDSYGHPIGDAALRALAQFLVRTVRSTDVVCRFGGEEFVVVLSDTSASAAMALAEKLRSQLAETQAGPEWALPTRFTMTCGVAASPDDGADADALVRVADFRLYRGKDGGRDCVVGPPD